MQKKLDSKRLLEAAQPSMQYLLRIPGKPHPVLEVLEAPFDPEFPEHIDEFNRWNHELGIQRRSILRIMAGIDEVSWMIRAALTEPGELGIGILGVNGLLFGLHIPEAKDIRWGEFTEAIERRMIFGTLEEKIINNWQAFSKAQRESSFITRCAAAEVCSTIQNGRRIPGIRVLGDIPGHARAFNCRVFLEER